MVQYSGSCSSSFIIQKEEDELLVERAIEPLSTNAGFYSNVFVVPKHTGHDYDIYIVLSGSIIICTSILLRRLTPLR